MLTPARTIVDVIRHGQPIGGSMYRGHRDDRLSELGWQQMNQAVGEYNRWQAVLSSPLLRCSEFAESLSKRHNLPLSYDDRFKEIDWGIWEGKTSHAICAEQPDKLYRFRADPVRLRPQGAEDVRDFKERVLQGWKDLIQQHHSKHVLLVAHAGVIRALISIVLDAPVQHMFSIKVANASITRISAHHLKEHDKYELEFHNGRL
jgi:alpha-ribazole phosphatase/probable phosphoglycerate mutase